LRKDDHDDIPNEPTPVLVHERPQLKAPIRGYKGDLVVSMFVAVAVAMFSFFFIFFFSFASTR